MSDTTTNPDGGNTPQQPEQQTPPQMRILGQFIRDLSFENILIQSSSAPEGKPDIQVQVSMDAKKRSTDNQYEVITKFKVTSRSQDHSTTLFVLELEYGAIFEVTNVPDQQLHPYLLIEGPRMMFPFVRRIVSDVTTDGGFPALNLENIDWVNLYRQSIAARAQQQQEQSGEGQGTPVN